MTQYIRLMGGGSGHLNFKAWRYVDMGKNAEPAERLEKIQAFQHWLLAPRIRLTVINNFQPAIEAAQRFDVWQVTKQMPLHRRQFHARDDTNDRACGRAQRRFNVVDFVMVGDRQ
jgi:hypothetical protein